jgi:hypothetical protein
MITDLDKISRLNRGDATQDTHVTETQVKVDIAKIVKSLDSPEKKKDFLRSQLIINTEYEEVK